MRLKLNSNVDVEFIESDQTSLPSPIVCFNDAYISITDENFQDATIHWYGSDYGYWSAEGGFYFSRSDLILNYVKVFLAVRANTKTGLSEAWFQTPPRTGFLRLTEATTFAMTLFDGLGYNTSYIAAYHDKALSSPTPKERIRIAPDFDLIFVDRTLCGWILHNPTLYLRVTEEDRYKELVEDQEISHIWNGYLDLMSPTGFRPIENKASEGLERLRDLKERLLNGGDHYRRQIIVDDIDRYISWYFK